MSVDNNSQPDLPQIEKIQRQLPHCTVLLNQANIGLSKALNRGIEQALTEEFDWLLLFDQDSRPAPEMLQRLLSVREQMQNQDQAGKIAAVGPAIYDQRLQKPLPFARFRYSGVKKFLPDIEHHELIETDMLITSGCLLSAQVIRDVGMMDERLFIDNIDMEWCFRAKAKGYRLFGVTDAVLYHCLGDHIRSLPYIDKAVLIHGPERQYHIMRNRLLLYWRSYVPLAWKFADFPHLLFKLSYFPLFVAPRWKNLQMLLKGLWAGIRNL